MTQKRNSGTRGAEQAVRDIRRATRRKFSAEEKIRIVLEGLRGEDTIAELCRKEGIVAGFEDIQRFVGEHGFSPRHGEDRDIFERLYAVRLDRMRELEECRTLLEPLDHQVF